jgi:hypothetical protein
VIDNIFIDKSKLENYSIGPPINDISDHDAQLIELHNIDLSSSNQQYQTVRKSDKYMIADYVKKLSYDTW